MACGRAVRRRCLASRSASRPGGTDLADPQEPEWEKLNCWILLAIGRSNATSCSEMYLLWMRRRAGSPKPGKQVRRQWSSERFQRAFPHRSHSRQSVPCGPWPSDKLPLLWPSLVSSLISLSLTLGALGAPPFYIKVDLDSLQTASHFPCSHQSAANPAQLHPIQLGALPSPPRTATSTPSASATTACSQPSTWYRRR